jgi:hypothetical protein
MATYKFPQFNVTITNPVVTVEKINDSINEKTCSADVLLTTNSAIFGVTFSGFTYVESWDDQDVIDWVNNVELPKYKVK